MHTRGCFENPVNRQDAKDAKSRHRGPLYFTGEAPGCVVEAPGCAVGRGRGTEARRRADPRETPLPRRRRGSVAAGGRRDVPRGRASPPIFIRRGWAAAHGELLKKAQMQGGTPQAE